MQAGMNDIGKAMAHENIGNKLVITILQPCAITVFFR